MKVVEIPIANIHWPECCCGCRRSKYAIVAHTENVVVWTVISITEYRQISIPVPMCMACAYKHLFWYAGAAALAAITLYVASLIESQSILAGATMGIFLMAAVAMILIGLKARPLNILGYNEESATLKLRVRNNQTADDLLRNGGAKPSTHKLVRKPYLIGLLLVLVFFVIAAIALK